MKSPTRSALIGVAWLTMFCALAGGAAAQKFPERPVRIVLGYSPGGTTDVVARLTAQALAERLGQNVLVDNRPGATGVIAVESVARAAPDGYTLLLVSNAEFSVLPALRSKLSFDPIRDFAPLAMLAELPVVYVSHPSVPASNIKELLEYAKKNPGAVHYGSSGIGGVLHLAGEMLKLRGNVDMVHVPYKGGGDMVAAVVAGHVEMIPIGPTNVAKYVASGQLRGLAVASTTRSEVLPAVPTMIESGFPDYVVPSWWGIVAPARVPEAVLNQLSNEIVAAASSPTYRARILDLGGGGKPLARERFGALIAEDIRKLREFGKAAHLSLDD